VVHQGHLVQQAFKEQVVLVLLELVVHLGPVVQLD
jgi:hypothetical protein